jgi:hypothetical protein
MVHLSAQEQKCYFWDILIVQDFVNRSSFWTKSAI